MERLVAESAVLKTSSLLEINTGHTAASFLYTAMIVWFWMSRKKLELDRKRHVGSLSSARERVWRYLSIFLVLASSAFLFSHKPIRLQLCDFHVILYPVRSNIVLGQLPWFSCSNQNMQLYNFAFHCIATCNWCDWLHNIAVKSRACTTKKPFQCHQTFPHTGIRGWERDHFMCDQSRCRIGVVITLCGAWYQNGFLQWT